MTERHIFEKIVSGGQTGAALGALDAALELGHPCGGWCPKGRKSEAGPIPAKYPVQELDSADYRVRNKQNVINSDGTMIFTYGKPTGGTSLTFNIAIKHEKPFYVCDLEDDPLNKDIDFIWEWGLESNVYVLNVAGPRESKHPNTQVLVKTVMFMLLEHARKSYPVVQA